MTDRITEHQSQTIARTLYEPTLRRINILLHSLITTTQNGDFALWAPLSVMEEQLRGLRWSDERSPERFLELIVLALRRYAEQIDVHRMAVVAARTAGVPAPPFMGWQETDTIALYDEIDAKYPHEAAVDAADPGHTDAPPDRKSVV